MIAVNNMEGEAIFTAMMEAMRNARCARSRPT
jgi:hypothetical protein